MLPVHPFPEKSMASYSSPDSNSQAASRDSSMSSGQAMAIDSSVESKAEDQYAASSAHPSHSYWIPPPGPPPPPSFTVCPVCNKLEPPAPNVAFPVCTGMPSQPEISAARDPLIHNDQVSSVASAVKATCVHSFSSASESEASAHALVSFSIHQPAYKVPLVW